VDSKAECDQCERTTRPYT